MGLLTARTRTALALATAAWLAGCAHAPAPPPADAPFWPAAPAKPVVRWAGAFPDARFEAPGRSLLRRIVDLIVGLEPERPAENVLRRPFGVAALETGFALADPDAHTVLRVNWRQGTFAQVTCPNHAWQMPLAVASSPAGELLVADGGGVVVRVGAGGACTLMGAGELQRPTGVTFAAGLIYVVDAPRHQVLGFDRDGKVKVRFGQHGAEEDGLNFPTAIAALPDGSLLVVDALNFRVVHFSAQGHYLGDFGQSGDGEGAFGRPKGVAVDLAGRIYVSDAQHDVVLQFAPDANFALAMGSTGKAPGQFLLPAGVAVGEGYLYVADSFNARVQIFELVGGDLP